MLRSCINVYQQYDALCAALCSCCFSLGGLADMLLGVLLQVLQKMLYLRREKRPSRRKNMAENVGGTVSFYLHCCHSLHICDSL
jgi:hypothetical protein